MVGISGQMNDSPVNQNDQILNPGAQDPGSQFTDKTIPTANTTISNNQGQTDDMSAFKKFVSNDEINNITFYGIYKVFLRMHQIHYFLCMLNVLQHFIYPFLSCSFI